ncbi:MAG: phage baseplate protein [Isosphaerales bacterium]
MRALSVPELLRVWENGLAQAAVDRALTLLEAACPDTPRDALASLSIGRRDANLLTLREWTFGPDMSSVVVCPQCGNKVEISFDVSAVRVSPKREPAPALEMAFADFELQVRPPNSLDLAAIAAEAGVDQRRRRLFERCLVTARRAGQPAAACDLPDETIDAVAERLAEADPQADVQLDIACPFCGHGWRAVFDIVTFFWSEIEAWACRVLREVHILASAYGWCERDILALTAARRQFYLEMVEA